MIERLKRLWALTAEIEHTEPFVEFECSECNVMLSVDNPVMPGEIGVIQCHNCGINWSVYCPQLVIRLVKNQELLYPHLEQIAESVDDGRG